MRKKKFTEKIYLKIKDKNNKEDLFDISNYDRQSLLDWHKLPNHYKIKLYIKFKCEDCKKEVNGIIGPNIGHQSINSILFCRKCNVEKTCLKLYGVTNKSKLDSVKEKTKQTNLKKYGYDSHNKSKKVKNKKKKSYLKSYGVDSILKSKKVQMKIKRTNLEKYGSENPFGSDEIKEKIKNTNLEKYGTEYAIQSEEVKEKIRHTMLELYGVDNYGKTKEYLEKTRSTNIERYGKESYSQTEDFIEKYQQTCLDRFGVENPLLLWTKYSFDNATFDSSWELAFYIYHKDKNHNIIRNKNKYFEYITKDKRIHHYYPDFKIGSKYYEIKGDQFITFYKNGKPKTLFESNEKYKCLKKHNVILLWSKQIKKYLNYIDNTYGKDYLKQFKIERNKKEKKKENEC